MMMGRLLSRGMLAGVFAALLAFVFARVFGEPQVNLAIAYEAAQAALANEPPEPELISRGVQAGWGLLTATVLYGAAYGGVFAIVFSCVYGRFSRLCARPLALWLAVICCVVAVVVPGLKYPPNPPAVGDPETIGVRTAAYFIMLGLSFCSAMIGVVIARHFAPRLGHWNANVLGVLLYGVLIAGLSAMLPDVSEVPADFPAQVLWHFRESALGMQLVLWAALGLVYGALAERVLEPARA